MLQRKITFPMLKSLRFMSHSNPFGVAREKLPALPAIETVRNADRNLEKLIETHLTRRKVTYGEYEFFQCHEGFILCYINAYKRKKEPEDSFYGVFYGTNHPLNNHGPVQGVQTIIHGRANAALSAIRAFPKIEAKKLCICTNCARTIKMMDSLQEYRENGYRRRTDGDVLEVKGTYVALTEALLSQNHLQFRFLFTPDIVREMKESLKLAIQASKLEFK